MSLGYTFSVTPSASISPPPPTPTNSPYIYEELQNEEDAETPRFPLYYWGIFGGILILLFIIVCLPFFIFFWRNSVAQERRYSLRLPDQDDLLL